MELQLQELEQVISLEEKEFFYNSLDEHLNEFDLKTKKDSNKTTINLSFKNTVINDLVNKCGHITKPIIEIIILLLYLDFDIDEFSSPINKKSLLLLLIASNMLPIPPCNFCTKYIPNTQAITNIKIA